MPDLPVPPLEMRTLVGPTDAAFFDNPDGALVFPGVTPEQFDSVLDFGCGCGRVARQLIQQVPRPRRYLGIDLHRGMIEWCRANLAPVAPGFEFLHHDVFEVGFNPGDEKVRWRPFPSADDSFGLVVAISVFTHVNQEHARLYLAEVARVLRTDGVAVTTWFLFDKREFPMMQEDQSALFINECNYTNAVIFDREWVIDAANQAGLTLVEAVPPEIRGFQWRLHFARRDSGRAAVPLPQDAAPFGINRAAYAPPNAHRVGLERENEAMP